MTQRTYTYWQMIWKQYCRHPLGLLALAVVGLFCLMAIYAPFLASSKPIWVYYEGQLYFPLFRYLFFPGFFTKPLDQFFNLFIFTGPLMVLIVVFLRHKASLCKWGLISVLVAHCVFFLYLLYFPPKDPASDRELTAKKQAELTLNRALELSWPAELSFKNDYAKLNLLLRYTLRQKQQQRLQPYIQKYEKTTGAHVPTLWQIDQDHELRKIQRNEEILKTSNSDSAIYKNAQAEIKYLTEKRQWLETQSQQLHALFMPLLRDFHWEDDAGGDQSFNQFLPWWELTRINRKDLVAALIFGIRISLVVGILAVALSLLIGLPIGAYAGYYGGKFDIVVCRLLEIWESMPTFFILLLVIAISQTKTIFLIISVIGIFGWTTFSRYIRGEFFKQRNLSYVEACHALGFNDTYIIFSHILPNAIPPVLTLLPFAIMGAITSEAGLSFLGLGEEGSCSWGVLMDEGRSAFPAESYLLWPPAILLTILLVSIALVGDSLRDALDPKMHK